MISGKLRRGLLGGVSCFAVICLGAPAAPNVVSVPALVVPERPFLWKVQGIGRGDDDQPAANDDDDDDEDWTPTSRPRRAAKPPLLPPTTTLTPEDTGIVVKYLEDSQSLCDRLPQRYKVDCLNTQLAGLVDRLPDTPELTPAKQALRQASNDLDRIVRQNAVRGGDRITASIPGVIETAAPLRPVRGARLESANAQASAVIDEAATILLRSSAVGGDVGESYQRIAAAVDSTKVLLRS